MTQRSLQARLKFALRRRCAVLLVLSCWLAGLVSGPAFAHKFHASITQMDYHDKEKSVAVVTRFFVDDFETAISQHAKRPIKFSTPQALKEKANADAVLSYVRERFELKSAKGVPVRFTWVGMEMQADMIWVYFAGKLAGGLAGAQVRNRVMHELFEDQVNIVNFKYDGKQSGTMFNAQDGFKLVPEKK